MRPARAARAMLGGDGRRASERGEPRLLGRWGSGIVAERDIRFPKGLRGSGMGVAGGVAPAATRGLGREHLQGRPSLGPPRERAWVAKAEVVSGSRRLGARAVAASGCSRTRGCSGARAHRCSWFIQRLSARPLNLVVRRLE